ncbi:MAG TPA: DUF2059 domain-containing protein [Pseudolabrys sp.]
MQSTGRTLRLATVAAALAFCGTAAQAQQQPSAAALASAREIVQVTGSTNLFTPLIAGVVEQAKLLLLQQNPNLSKPLTEIADKIKTDLSPRFDELVNELARQYALHFNEQELKDLLAFYTSPLGKKFLVEQPAVVDAGFKFAQTWGNSLSDEVLAKMRGELKKQGYAL